MKLLYDLPFSSENVWYFDWRCHLIFHPLKLSFLKGQRNSIGFFVKTKTFMGNKLLDFFYFFFRCNIAFNIFIYDLAFLCENVWHFDWRSHLIFLPLKLLFLKGQMNSVGFLVKSKTFLGNNLLHFFFIFFFWCNIA